MLVDIGGGTRLFVEVQGPLFVPDGPVMRERPTLICLHGAEVDHSWFRPNFEVLEDVAQIMYIDHRGFGRSGRSDPATYTLQQRGDDVHRLCEVLGIERPIVLGSSFGGMVTISYATRHPDHPRALILASTPPRRNVEATFAAYRRHGGDEAEAVARRFFADPSDQAARERYGEVCMPLLHHFRWTEDELSRIAESDPDCHRAADPNYNLLPAVQRIICPVLLIAGEDDPATPPEVMEEIEGALAAGLASLERVPKAGHGVCRDAPERFFRAVRSFIGEVS